MIGQTNLNRPIIIKIYINLHVVLLVKSAILKFSTLFAIVQFKILKLSIKAIDSKMNKQKSNKVIKNIKDKQLIHHQFDQKRQKTPSSIHNVSSIRKQNEKVMRQKKQKSSKQRKKTPKPMLKGDSQDNNNKKYDLNMKDDLKMLISKNNKKTQNKAGAKDLAPDILKNIQKYCKLLKNIHSKQQQNQKKTSFKDNKQFKSFKKSSIQINRNTSTHQTNEIHNPEKILVQQQHSNHHRYSMEIAANLKTVNEQKQYLIKSRRKGGVEELRTKSRRQSRDVIKICQQYKKNVQENQAKLQSGKVTNYNSNQSRNISSLCASHGFSHVNNIDSLNKSKQQQFIKNKQDIEKMIKSQKESLEKIPLENRRKQLKLQKVHQIMCMPIKKSSFNELDINEIECKFRQSKYFVMQVPAIVRAEKKEILQKEDPLLGCEITLIENNIFEEESGLAQLQL